MSVTVGTKVTGKVTGITNFGAFVDLVEGQTGLVHISEVSNEFVKDIHDVLKAGDVVQVLVMTVKDGKIGLSIRKASGDAEQGHHGAHNNHDRGNREHGNAHNGDRPAGNRSHGPGQNNRPAQNGRPSARHDFSKKPEPKGDDFDSLLSGFLKDSEQRLSTLRHNTEGKRGGRGGRRS